MIKELSRVLKLKRYESRFQAGKILVEFIKSQSKKLEKDLLDNPNRFFCFAIPNGGVPVTEGFCSHLSLEYDILIVRKIKIPFNTEAGFGSITTDGTIFINQPLLTRLNLSEEAKKALIELTKTEIDDRLKFYKKGSDLEQFYKKHVQNKYIFILDDGLASGFTMMAAINMIKKYNPMKIFITVPTAPLRTINKLKNDVNEIFCPNIRDVMWFAVADAYKHWYDVPESEVLEILNKSKYYVNDTD